MQEHLSKKIAQVGCFDAKLPGPVQKMRPMPEGFRSLGIAALNRCSQSESPWVLIDEIGYLESSCPPYCDAIRQLMEKKRLLGAVRKQNLPFLSELCRRTDVFLVDLDAPFGNLGCVIMASGLGRRFGGQKLMEVFREKPLIQWALDATEGVFARRIVVTRHEDVRDLCLSQNIPVLFHNLPKRSDTVRLGLKTIVRNIDGCMFCPADQPLLRQETVACLALCAVHEKKYIWRPSYEGSPGSPILFPRWTFSQLLHLPSGKGGNVIAKAYPKQVRLLPVLDPLELSDVDRPVDLQRLKER